MMFALGLGDFETGRFYMERGWTLSSKHAKRFYDAGSVKRTAEDLRLMSAELILLNDEGQAVAGIRIRGLSGIRFKFGRTFSTPEQSVRGANYKVAGAVLPAKLKPTAKRTAATAECDKKSRRFE